MREARAAAALGHPNIVQVSDFQILPNEPPFIVLEYLEGQTLGERLREEPRLDVRRICTIAHRDIKPDNVFLSKLPNIEDFVKLLDFGIAKLQDANDAHRCALAGRYPFEAPNMSALLYAIAHTKAPSLTSVNPAIDLAFALVVERAMHKDPQARFASATKMRAALLQWSQTPDHVAPPNAAPMLTPPTQLVQRSTPREGPSHAVTAPTQRMGVIVALVALLASLLLLGAGVVGVIVYLHHEEPSPVASTSKPAPVVAPVATVVETASASGAAPAATPKPAPSPAPTPAPTPSAKRMGARTATLTLGDCTFELAECRAAVAPLMPSVQACFAATELDPPPHEVADYSIMLDKSGAVTDVRRHKSGENVAHPKLDACIASALRRAKYPRSPGNTRVEVFFRARL